MDRSYFYTLMEGDGQRSYEVYLNTPQILSAQKSFNELCNQDELMFQVVHQVEELWMKLIGYTLLDIDDYITETNTNRIITLFKRVHLLLNLMTQQLQVVETMSPKEYQEIRLQLGNGSGQESPGFRAILKMPQHLWNSYKFSYLEGKNLNIKEVYDSRYDHGDAYMVAESLIEFDELFQRFRIHHLQLVYRSIGISAKSIKGRPVELLQQGIKHRFFPELWDLRSEMTDAWGGEYGVKRSNLKQTEESNDA